MDKNFVYNSKYGIIKEDIKILNNRRFIPSIIFCSAINFACKDFSFSVGGAALSKKDSILSTIGEFSERFAANTVHVNNVPIIDSYYNLKSKGENIIDISILNQFYSEKQYNDSDKIRPLYENDIIEWQRCKDIFHKKEVLLPNYCIYLNRKSILSDNLSPVYSVPSTGLSAHINEKLAIESGFLENVERHSFCDFWYLQNYKNYPVYDATEILNFFKDNTNIQILYNNPSVTIRCYDLTSVCNIPTFLNIVIFRYKEKCYISSGAASKFSYEEAILKSIIEAYQGIELALWLDREYKGWNYINSYTIGKDVTNFHKHFAFYNSHKHFREEVPVLAKVLNKNFSSDTFSPNANIIDSFQIENLKNIDGIKNIYYKNITPKEIKNLGLEVVKVFVAGFHQLTGDHNYPFLGSFQSNLNNLFLKYPHFFP